MYFNHSMLSNIYNYSLSDLAGLHYIPEINAMQSKMTGESPEVAPTQGNQEKKEKKEKKKKMFSICPQDVI